MYVSRAPARQLNGALLDAPQHRHCLCIRLPIDQGQNRRTDGWMLMKTENS